MGKVDMLVDLWRHVRDHEQPRNARIAHRNCLGADRHQHVVLNGARQVGGIALHQHSADGRGGAEPLLQPAQPEIRDRRNEDEDFRKEHEEDRQQEQLGRQPARQRDRPALRSSARMPVSATGCSAIDASSEACLSGPTRGRFSRKGAAGGSRRRTSGFRVAPIK